MPGRLMTERFPDVPDLTHCLRELLAQVPAGRVTTCGDLAEALGNRIAARWVGHYALHHDHRPTCTCHRIVRLGGELGGYAGGAMRAKVRRLRDEGVEVRRGTIDLERFGFRDFVTDRPLERLREIQTAIQRRIVVRPRRRMPKLIGGVDVGYPQPELGVAAYALVETATGQLVWSTTVRRARHFSLREHVSELPRNPDSAGSARRGACGGTDGRGVAGRRQRHPAPRARRESPRTWAWWRRWPRSA